MRIGEVRGRDTEVWPRSTTVLPVNDNKNETQTVASNTNSTTNAPRDLGVRIGWLDVMRAVAVLMVAYDHLVALYLKQTGQTLWVHTLITRYVVEPFGIIQDFGWMGVCLFFLVSGFVITHVAYRERPTEFVVRRIFRIYPPLVVAILISVLILRYQRDLTFSITEVLVSFTLLNYFQTPQVVTLGIAWSLLVEIFFYGLVVCQMGLLKRVPLLATIFAIFGTTIVVYYCREFGHTYFLVAATFAYVPYLLFGQIVYLRATRRISTLEAMLLAVLCYGSLVLGVQRIHTQFHPIGNSYLLSFAYALLIFITALAMDLKPGLILRSVAQKSYGIYLLEGTLGVYLIFWLQGIGLPYSVALTGSVAAGYAFCIVFYRLIEHPAQNFGRRIGRFIGA